MTLAARAMAQLRDWPDLSEAGPSCGTGQGMGSVRGELLHFHSGQDADLRLTVGVVRRLAEDLAASPAVRVVPGSPWVTLHLESDADIDLLIMLVSVALQADQTWPLLGETRQDRCNNARIQCL
ncbi:luciferase family protein [Streptomyces sp. NPDC021093]|uniref:luciferase domain-containing protein n=1 Tax=Streptomyces sp. NPDC021093 TaxID=3365112 RepID=UPI0037B3BA9C